MKEVGVVRESFSSTSAAPYPAAATFSRDGRHLYVYFPETTVRFGDTVLVNVALLLGPLSVFNVGARYHLFREKTKLSVFNVGARYRLFREKTKRLKKWIVPLHRALPRSCCLQKHVMLRHAAERFIPTNLLGKKLSVLKKGVACCSQIIPQTTCLCSTWPEPWTRSGGPTCS